MSAVRKVNIRAFVIGHAKGFPGECGDGGVRTGVLPGLSPGWPWVTQPRAEAGVEKRHDNGPERGGVVAHVGTGRGSGNGYGGAERDAGGSAVVKRIAIAEVGIAAVQRRDSERLGLALLPGEAFAGDQIQCGIHNVERAHAAQAGHFQVVAFGKAGEGIDVYPVGIGSALVGTSQPVAVHAVQREFIDIDEVAHHRAEQGKGGDQGDAGPPRRELQNHIVLMPGDFSQPGRGMHQIQSQQETVDRNGERDTQGEDEYQGRSGNKATPEGRRPASGGLAGGGVVSGAGIELADPCAGGADGGNQGRSPHSPGEYPFGSEQDDATTNGPDQAGHLKQAGGTGQPFARFVFQLATGEANENDGAEFEKLDNEGRRNRDKSFPTEFTEHPIGEKPGGGAHGDTHQHKGERQGADDEADPFPPRLAAGENEGNPGDDEGREHPGHLLQPGRFDIAITPEIEALKNGEDEGADHGGQENSEQISFLRAVLAAYSRQFPHVLQHAESKKGGDDNQQAGIDQQGLGNRRRGAGKITQDFAQPGDGDQKAGNHENRDQKRHQDKPVEHDVAGNGGDERPGIGGESSQFGREEIIVFAQMTDGIHFTGGGRRSIGPELGDDFIATGALNPGSKPTAGVAATGNGGEVVERREEAFFGETLQCAEGKRSGADTAAGDTKCVERTRGGGVITQDGGTFSG